MADQQFPLTVNEVLDRPSTSIRPSNLAEARAMEAGFASWRFRLPTPNHERPP